MEICLTEKVDNSESGEKETAWLKYRTNTGHLVAFWGEPNLPNRNITALKNQRLPFLVEIFNPEDCLPTEYEKKKYGLMLSVPSDEGVFINPAS